MGISSDVVVALKNNVFEGLSAESKETLKEWFKLASGLTEEGVLFYGENVKWYNETYEDLIAFYNDLENFDEEDYLILVGCHGYPHSTKADAGDWYDNPWDIYKAVSVRIAWEDPPSAYEGGLLSKLQAIRAQRDIFDKASLTG
tara:strand:+ start:770 stop:1201 length:432 start_codon:yes stop_codon:yes gene_type:complete